MYATAYGACIGCGRLFSFNPVRVPSLPANVSPTGSKEPICLDCVIRCNPLRIKNGLEPIVPAPDAYDACDEWELD